MFIGRASLRPTGRRTYSTRETPALSDTERALKKVRQKRVDEKNNGKEKSVLVPQNIFYYLFCFNV